MTIDKSVFIDCDIPGLADLFCEIPKASTNSVGRSHSLTKFSTQNAKLSSVDSQVGMKSQQANSSEKQTRVTN